MEFIFSLENINHVAKVFRKQTEGKKVFAFHGQMGAGKTTFIQVLCEVIGVKEVMSSPTFSIINEYTVNNNEAGKEKVIYHMDLYRVKSEKEAIGAGVEECLYSGHICLVEWPEKAPALFPEDTVHVFIDVEDETTRRLRIHRK